MPPSLASVLRNCDDYEYYHVKTAKKAVCIICKEPFATASSSSACQAIRLRSCGHIIGLECFQTWISQQPLICPYFNHDLPTGPAQRMAPQGSLKWFCSTQWFEWIEEVVFAILQEDVVSAGHFTTSRAGLDAIRANQPTMTHAISLLFLYNYASLALQISVAGPNLITTYLVAVLIAAFVQRVWPYSPTWPPLTTLVGCVPRFIAYFYMFRAVMWFAIILSLLSIGLWKSYWPSRPGGKQAYTGQETIHRRVLRSGHHSTSWRCWRKDFRR